MSATDLLALLTRISFLLIAFLTLVDWIRHRDLRRLEIALVFNSLAMTIFVQVFGDITGLKAIWLTTLGSLAIMAHPYLLLRLVQHFRVVPRVVQRAALVGMIACWLIMIFVPAPLPGVATLAVIGYFVLVEGYAAIAFVRGASTSSGVIRQRLILVSTGTALLAVVLLIAGIMTVVPGLKDLGGALVQLLAIVSALSFFLGFTSPRPLRHAWQLSELYTYLRESAGLSVGKSADELLNQLCITAARSVGGLAAVVALWDDDEKRLLIRATTRASSALSGEVTTDDGIAARAWRERQPIVAHTPSEFGTDEARFAATLGAEALLVVPIATRERAWGLLLVFLRHSPLFATDDLSLLALFTEQCALALAYTVLLDAERTLIEQLKRRSAQVEAANKELEAFSYSVSHDLRAPLRSIAGFSEILMEDYAEQLDAVGRDHLRRIHQAAERMAELIDAVIALARVTRAEINPESLDLSALATSIAEDLHQREPDREVQVEVHPGLRAEGDARLIRAALENLIGNAWKYTEKHPHARIEFGADGKRDGKRVYFVRDDGAGFDMAYADKLFGAFQRLHGMNEFKGTGIGLAAVQRIIHHHGGEVWADGELEKGATFYFTL